MKNTKLSKDQKRFLLKYRWYVTSFQINDLNSYEVADLVDKNIIRTSGEYKMFFVLTKHGRYLARRTRMDKVTGKIYFKENGNMKKIALGAVLAVVGLSGMGYGTGAMSYVSTMWNQASDAIQNEVPIEFQLERARGILKQLQPEIKETLLKVARKETEYDAINVRLAEAQQKSDEQKQELMASDGIDNNTRILYVSHKTNQSTVNSLAQLASLKQQTIEAGKTKLLQLSQAQTALKITIEELEVRNETLKLLQNEAGTFEDSTVLAEVQGIITHLTERIGVAEKLLNIEDTLSQEVAHDTSLDDEIAGFITGNKPESQVAATK